MDWNALEVLLEKISRDPSVLLLGQNYLGSKNGQNPFIEELSKSFPKKNINSRSSYTEIWECLDESGRLPDVALTEMVEAARRISVQPWLRKILEINWNIIYTSSIDDALTTRVGDNFGLTPIRCEECIFRRDFISKRQLHCVYLFGGLHEMHERHTTIPRSRRELRSLRAPAEQKIGWIPQDIIPGYGVLVIDGWSPEKDWLESESLFARLYGLHEESVYLFGFKDEMYDYEDIKALIDDKIIVPVTHSLAQLLDTHGYFDGFSEDAYSYGDAPDKNDVTLTVRFKNRHEEYVFVSPEDLGTLDSCITLLDDRMEIPARIDKADRKQKFASFLSQQGNPTWAFYHRQVGFYFERLCDEELGKAVKRQLKLDGFNRQLIILDGPSNSGKTTTLANLAVNLKLERESPVFFICGEPGQIDFADGLKKFIKKYFTEYRSKLGESIKNVIVIWDNSSAMHDERKYRRLKQELAECNALIIGSCYARETPESNASSGVSASRKRLDYRIPIESKLYDDERKKFENVLKSISEEYLQRFDAIMAKRKEKSSASSVDRNESNNIFYILEKLFEYEFDPEYLTIRELLRGRLRTESNVVEQRAEHRLESFLNNFEETSKAILEKGLASGWQIKLQEWMDKHGKIKNSTSVTSQADEDLQKKKHLEQTINKINGLLAVAGQFGIELPLMLLLRIIQSYDPRAKNLFRAEAKFLVEVIEDDSLVRTRATADGERFVRFRHAFEAEKYLDIQTSGRLESEKQQFEVSLLKTLIAHSNFGYGEANVPSYRAILNLVRQFGPNSHGKPSERERVRGYYQLYKSFWVEIADYLLEHSHDDPEAILVSAHFLRESSTDNGTLLIRAREYLTRAINSPNVDKNSPQYCRLLVELCSNLVTEQLSADDKRSGVIVKDVRKFLSEVSNKYRNIRDSSDTNRLLDIWLNCFKNHIDKLHAVDASYAERHEFQELLVETLSNIDNWFNIADDFEEFNLLGKIYTVYGAIGNDRLLTSLEHSFVEKKNDTFLYLQARLLWQNSNTEICTDSIDKLIRKDLYLIPDMPPTGLDIPGDLKAAAHRAAKSSIEFLASEENKKIIKNTKSYRCLEILIRSKWMSYTGYFPFEAGQKISLTAAQWADIAALCELCIEYGSEYLPARFIRAMYLWLYSDPVEAKQLFQGVNKRYGGAWQIKRVILCCLDQGQIKPRLFKVSVLPHGDSLKAKIEKETTMQGDSLQGDRTVGRYGIYISRHMLSYLFDLATPSPRNYLDKPCALHFNLDGPVLGDPKAD